MNSPRILREKRGFTMVKVAATAAVSLGTLRAYELNPQAIRPRIRERIDAVYRGLEEGVHA